MSACSTCKVPMIWAVSPNGKRLPLDARPVPVLLRERVLPPNATPKRYRTEARGGELHAVEDPEGAYVSHFVTCPTRDEHRKR